MSEAFQLIPHPQSELTRKTTLRIGDPKLWSDTESDNLVDLLEDMDGLKQEIHERIRRVEAVRQARSLIREDAIRTEALNQKLSEMRRAIGQAQTSHTQTGQAQPGQQPEAPTSTWREDADLLRMPSREPSADTVAWQANAYRSAFPESCECPTTTPMQENPEPQATMADDPLLVNPQDNQPSASTPPAPEAFENATRLLTHAEQAWKQSEEAIVEARQLLEQSIAQLSQAIGREERAAGEFKATQQELTTAYQFAAVAAQRQHNAAEFFHKTHHWTVTAAALAWTATIWVAWAAFHAHLHLWSPLAATASVAGLAVYTSKWSTKDQG